jgi:hypothetical protein
MFITGVNDTGDKLFTGVNYNSLPTRSLSLFSKVHSGSKVRYSAIFLSVR